MDLKTSYTGGKIRRRTSTLEECREYVMELEDALQDLREQLQVKQDRIDELELRLGVTDHD